MSRPAFILPNLNIILSPFPLLTFPAILHPDHFIFLLLSIFSLLNKWLKITQVRHNILCQVIFHYGEIRYRRVDLLWCTLFRHNPKQMLLLCWLFAKLFQGICLCCYIQLWGFSLAWIMGKHLSPLKLLFQRVLIVLLQFLYLLCDRKWFFLFYDWLRLWLWLLFLDRLTPGICQIVETFVFKLLVSVALELHLLYDNLLEIVTVRIVFGLLHYVMKRCTLLFLFLLLLQLFLVVADLFLYQLDLRRQILVTGQFGQLGLVVLLLVQCRIVRLLQRFRHKSALTRLIRLILPEPRHNPY